MKEKKKYILLVEDDNFLGPNYKIALEAAGHKIKLVVNGQEALAALEGEIPDLVLLDIFMPIIDGVEVLKKVSENERLKDMPIIVLSNLADSEEMKKCIDLGAKDYMVKSNWDISDIKKRIELFLD